MPAHAGTCPLTQRQLIDKEFMEQRVKVLELAAFLDRLQRARELDGEEDFRLQATRRALAVLSEDAGDRVKRVQMLFSDPRTDLLPELDRKAAYGAYDHQAR
jgi:hypothetical protein